MNRALFTPRAPGELVQQAIQGQPDWAFIPNPLPPHWSLPNDLWPLVSLASERIGILEGIGRNLPNPDILLSPLIRTEALKSSSIEGTYATPMELLMYELAPREASSERERVNDWRQILNYRDSLSYGLAAAAEQDAISLNLIRQMHSVLLRGVRGRDRHPGEWRPDMVMVGFPPRFVPPPRHCLEPCLDGLIDFANAEGDYDYLTKAFLVHYQFETIHPFSDGNGRMGRLLLAMNICQWSPLTKPWLFLSSFFERNRDEYIDRLFGVSAAGSWSAWVEFCLKGTIAVADETIARVESLRRLQLELHDKVRLAGGSVRLASIVDRLFVSPYITTTDAAEVTGVSRPTARGDIRRLIGCNILEKLSGQRPVLYFSPAVFRTCYADA